MSQGGEFSEFEPGVLVGEQSFSQHLSLPYLLHILAKVVSKVSHQTVGARDSQTSLHSILMFGMRR
jgi:hypothetical protein